MLRLRNFGITKSPKHIEKINKFKKNKWVFIGIVIFLVTFILVSIIALKIYTRKRSLKSKEVMRINRNVNDKI